LSFIVLLKLVEFQIDCGSPFFIRLPTADERAAVAAEKRRKKLEEEDELTQQKWRFVDRKQECFLLDSLPAEDVFLELNLRNQTCSFFDIFHRFMTDEVAQRLYNSIHEDDMVMHHRASGGAHSFVMKKEYVWQALAIQVRIIGQQIKSNEANPIHRLLSASVKQCRGHFLSMGEVVSQEVMERLLARMLMTEHYSDELSRNFQSLVFHLGQSISGDEKLFHFTGDSGNVRLVITKPDRIGLWFYELCGKFSNGTAYLINLFMHNSSRTTVPVASVVRKWAAVMKDIALKSLYPGNAKCYLAFDSYYSDTTAREELNSEGIYFTCSVKADNIKPFVRAIHPLGADRSADTTRVLYNDDTQQLFVYHNDPQEGVGERYNFSYGFKRCTNKFIVKDHLNRIPADDYYKTFF